MQPEDIIKQYEAKINLHHFNEVEPLLSDECVIWFADGSYSGKTEIQAAFEKTWQTLNNDAYWLEHIVWIAKGNNVATCIYQFNWKTEIDGKTIAGKGRGTTVLRKENEEWKIIHEHLSPFA